MVLLNLICIIAEWTSIYFISLRVGMLYILGQCFLCPAINQRRVVYNRGFQVSVVALNNEGHWLCCLLLALNWAFTDPAKPL